MCRAATYTYISAYKKRMPLWDILFFLHEADGARTRDLSRDRAAL